MRLPSLEARQNTQLEAMQSRQRASGTENSLGLLSLLELQAGGLVIGRVRDQAISATVVEQVPQPEGPLVLCKTVDKHSAQIGDIVTFTLKYTNTGGQPITDVAVSDSLTGRLEYVPGSAKSDRQALFTLQENEAGSLILRWQIGGSLPAGQSGIVAFQARIR
jgi:uncharacterized repeat protein (TIGR01451 family)